MPTTQTTLTTEHASKYLQQLCKHFQHKVPATWNEHEGTVAFPMGNGHFTATQNTLHLQAQTDDADQLERLEHVIQKHLTMFAFREELQFNWTRSA